MWCSTCQQDVPAIASFDEAVVCCARCHSPLRSHADALGPSKSSEVSATPAGPPPREDWQWEDDLHAAGHVLGMIRGETASPAAASATSPSAPPHAARPSRDRAASRGGRMSLTAWCLISLGLMALVFGGVLLGWSFATERAELWRLGMPFTLGGQAALVIGLVFQLDGLWRSNREACATLSELDEQLDELRHATSLLSTTHSSPAQSFYVHLAERASPHLLLADLKGQLDVLAMRLSDQRD